MASIWIPFCLVVVLGLNFMRKWIKGSNNEVKKKLPPGPRKLPLIGNMHHLMGSLPHHALTKLAKKHGDLMHLQLGEISAIVVSSPRVAKTVLKSHDTAVSNRPDFLVGRIIFYDYSDLGFAPYGDYWRQLRKICNLELLSTKSVRSFASIRQDEVSKLVSSIREEALFEQRKQGTNLTRKVSSYTISMISRAAFGRAFERHQEKLAELMREVLFRMSGFDASDLFPSWKVLQHLSLMKPKLMELRSRADEILDVIIQDHVENPTGKNGEFGQEDLIDVLLRIKQGGGDYNFPLTNTNIKGILLDMFTGGAETSLTVVVWAMAEMMRNPRVLAKAQTEIRQVILSAGNKPITIEESDIQKLRYLKLVIKETLRVHPPLPLLVPRDSREQYEVDGYIIPPKTRVIVNAWTIGRDPKYWDDPESFIPERFENTAIDFLGNDYEYLPFGTGKRICPGISFGLANMEVPLTNLLYHFDWNLPNDIITTGLDMTESYGITAAMKNDLFLVPSPL